MTSMRQIAENSRLTSIQIDARRHAQEAVRLLDIRGDIDGAERELRASLALVAQLKEAKQPA